MALGKYAMSLGYHLTFLMSEIVDMVCFELGDQELRNRNGVYTALFAGVPVTLQLAKHGFHAHVHVRYLGCPPRSSSGWQQALFSEGLPIIARVSNDMGQEGCPRPHRRSEQSIQRYLVSLNKPGMIDLQPSFSKQYSITAVVLREQVRTMRQYLNKPMDGCDFQQYLWSLPVKEINRSVHQLRRKILTSIGEWKRLPEAERNTSTSWYAMATNQQKYNFLKATCRNNSEWESVRESHLCDRAIKLYGNNSHRFFERLWRVAMQMRCTCMDDWSADELEQYDEKIRRRNEAYERLREANARADLEAKIRRVLNKTADEPEDPTIDAELAPDKTASGVATSSKGKSDRRHSVKEITAMVQESDLFQNYKRALKQKQIVEPDRDIVPHPGNYLHQLFFEQATTSARNQNLSFEGESAAAGKTSLMGIVSGTAETELHEVLILRVAPTEQGMRYRYCLNTKK